MQDPTPPTANALDSVLQGAKKPLDDGFHAVDGSSVQQPNTARFRVGERLPWKGLVFAVTRFSDSELTLRIVGATAKAKAKLNTSHRKAKPKRKGRRKRKAKR